MKKVRFSPTLCLTHNCNLNCVYCYQKHDTHSNMTFEVAKESIDWIFNNIPDDMEGVEVGFIGGEPLLRFDLIKDIISYTCQKYKREKKIFYATTNGTVLTDEMKTWFTEHKDIFVLGLSLDGLPETHNHNRSNSYELIDIDFFVKTWPDQGIKMTLTEKSLEDLSDNIIYLHSLGFKEVGGVNLFEGTFDWSDEKYIKMIIPHLEKLVSFYVENDELNIDQMLDRKIEICEVKPRELKKWCGIGTGSIFFDVDGRRLPCPFVTPMTFDEQQINELTNVDYNKVDDFIDDDCFNSCYMYPVCPHCAGANYLTQGTFKTRDKSRCRIQKLITLFSADLHAKRLLKNPERYDDAEKYNLINAIKMIKSECLSEFSEYFIED